jgi:hypothetical protein
MMTSSTDSSPGMTCREWKNMVRMMRFLRASMIRRITND